MQGPKIGHLQVIAVGAQLMLVGKRFLEVFLDALVSRGDEE